MFQDRRERDVIAEIAAEAVSAEIAVGTTAADHRAEIAAATIAADRQAEIAAATIAADHRAETAAGTTAADHRAVKAVKAVRVQDLRMFNHPSNLHRKEAAANDITEKS